MVEILMATYNGEPYIEEQIESIIIQSYTNWRILFRDDGSSDGTMGILMRYVQEYPDKMRLIQDGEKSGGACNNFMRLIGQAQAEYVMFCDQDDVWNPDKIEISLKYLKQIAESGGETIPTLVCTNVSVVDEKLQPVALNERKLPVYHNSVTFSKLLVQNYYMGCTMIFNRELYSLIKTVPEHILMHDWWIALMAAGLGQIAYLPEKTMKYRQHGDNTVGASEIGTVGYAISKFRNKSASTLCEKMIEQAKDYQDEYDYLLSREKQELLSRFVHLKEKNKLLRIYEQVRYGMLKGTCLRALGQLFYM